MLRTAARFLAVTTVAVALLLPAVPAAAAPSSDAGWVVALLDAVAGWLPTFGRVTASEEGEALPNIDPNGLTTGTVGAQSSATGGSGETYPNLDPDGLTGTHAGPHSQTSGGQEDTYPNLDPNG